MNNNYARYSGMALQMLGTIGLGVFLGYQLDGYLQNKIPWATVVCSLGFTVGSLVAFIKGLPKE
jgi:F0F1-type ATP synthase assembly protein I